MSGAEVFNEGLSGSLNAYRARLDGRHAIEIDAPGDAFDPDDGGVAAENFSPRARRVCTNEPLSLLYSTGVRFGWTRSKIDLGAELVWSISHCASPMCSARPNGNPRPRERRF